MTKHRRPYHKKPGLIFELLILSLYVAQRCKSLREFAAVSERFTYNPNFSLNVEYVSLRYQPESISPRTKMRSRLMKICSGILKNRIIMHTDILVFPDMPQKMSASSVSTARAVLIGILQPSLTFCVKMIWLLRACGTARHHFLEVCDSDMGAQSVEKETKKACFSGKLTEVEAAAKRQKNAWTIFWKQFVRF